MAIYLVIIPQMVSNPSAAVHHHIIQQLLHITHQLSTLYNPPASTSSSWFHHVIQLITSSCHYHITISCHHHITHQLSPSVTDLGNFCVKNLQILQSTSLNSAKHRISALLCFIWKKFGVFCKIHDIFIKWGKNGEISAHSVLSSFIKHCKFCS